MRNTLKNVITVKGEMLRLGQCVSSLLSCEANEAEVRSAISEYFVYMNAADEAGIFTGDSHKKVSALIGGTLDISQVQPPIFKEIMRRFPHSVHQIGTIEAHKNPEAALSYLHTSFKNAESGADYSQVVGHALAIAKRSDLALALSIVEIVKASFPDMDVESSSYKKIVRGLAELLQQLEYANKDERCVLDKAVAQALIFFADKIKLNSSNGYLPLHTETLPKLLRFPFNESAKAAFDNFFYYASSLDDYADIYREHGWLLSDDEMQKRLSNVFNGDPQSQVDKSVLNFTAASMLRLKLKLQHVCGYEPIIEIFAPNAKNITHLVTLVNNAKDFSDQSTSAYSKALFSALRSSPSEAMKMVVGELGKTPLGEAVLAAAKASRESSRLILSSDLSL